VQPAVEVQALSKCYRLYRRQRHRLLEALSLGWRSWHTEFWALRDVSLEVESGSTLGIMGLNGSGKSTLLQVIAGILRPTMGRVTVNGRIAALLELGAGFSPEFTGRENVEMYGLITGLPRDLVRRRMPDIEAFADIGDFIDRPVKSYSSGMYVRLAFAAAIHVDPDVLLVDEALAVGDALFQHKCLRRISELQEQGKTILFVSHDMGLIKSVCTKVALLHQGRLVKLGDPEDIVNLYHAQVGEAERSRVDGAPTEAPAGGEADFERRTGLLRHGTGAARIRNVELLDAEGRPVTGVAFGMEVTLRVHAEFYEAVPVSIVGYSFRDRTGIDVIGTNTYEERTPIPPRRAGDRVVVDFRQHVPLQPGTYSVTVACAYNPTQRVYLDWVDHCLFFEVRPPGLKHIHGKVGLPVEVSVRT
jgi:ABC-type polysaccharide/polyol phosphate transport system ATPase subunit